MSSNTAEFDLGNFPKADEVDKIEETLLGAIDAIEKEGWTDAGWTDDQKNGLCILNAVNLAHTGHRTTNGKKIPAKIINLIHDQIWPNRDSWQYEEMKYYGDSESPSKDALADEIIEWNDGGEAESQSHVIRILKGALRRHRKEKK